MKGNNDFDYLDYNFDEDTLEDFGGGKDSKDGTWRSQYEGRRNPNASEGKAQAFASFLFEDELSTVEDDGDEEEENDDEDGVEEVEGPQNSAVLNELLRLFKMSKKGKQ